MCKEIPLTRGLVALIDDCDFERVAAFRWSIDGNGYVIRNESIYVDGERTRKQILLHRFVMDAPPGSEVDHIHHNRLDNRRDSLRLVTRRQNAFNMRPHRDALSSYKGVSWHKRDSKWVSYIRVDGRHIFLGTFTREQDAALAYDVAAYDAWGEFAYINLPDLLQVHT